MACPLGGLLVQELTETGQLLSRPEPLASLDMRSPETQKLLNMDFRVDATDDGFVNTTAVSGKAKGYVSKTVSGSDSEMMIEVVSAATLDRSDKQTCAMLFGKNSWGGNPARRP